MDLPMDQRARESINRVRLLMGEPSYALSDTEWVLLIHDLYSDKSAYLKGLFATFALLDVWDQVVEAGKDTDWGAVGTFLLPIVEMVKRRAPTVKAFVELGEEAGPAGALSVLIKSDITMKQLVDNTDQVENVLRENWRELSGTDWNEAKLSETMGIFIVIINPAWLVFSQLLKNPEAGPRMIPIRVSIARDAQDLINTFDPMTLARAFARCT